MKTYVAVVALHPIKGRIKPLFVVWENGVKYSIDQVLRIERAASLKHGGVGWRYTVRIEGKLRWLYYEDPGWFIEKCE